jgi:uncharacterized protein YjbI with pentapeptide repeats
MPTSKKDHLQNVDFQNINFQNVNLQNVHFQNVDFQNDNVNFIDAILTASHMG